MCHWKCMPQKKILIKYFEKLLEIFFFPICSLWSGNRRTQFFSGDDMKQKKKAQIFWRAGRPTKFSPLVGHPNLHIRKTLRRVLDSLTVMILKRLNESIFFQINKFIEYKFTKEVANFLMAFNLLKIIHSFQGKKHLRTYWNLNCKPQKYLIS